ncbi:hypothetical protein [Dyella acidiphila]|uniref:Uncharacterized protein n=1 Tax=Dyella acidiphila TaxID=2775866 RepID=A0ABR9G7C4_9GAMM|nr:hypothetical protein [Dyella acidiphila]MBE1159913.1 hypothetical protein [Dyella acidiphila]
MNSDNRAWFGPKRIGWGYGPRSWQGWLTVAIYALLMMTLPTFLGPQLGQNGVRTVWIVLTVLFFVVFFWKLDRRAS